jgi:hypothetical protein
MENKIKKKEGCFSRKEENYNKYEFSLIRKESENKNDLFTFNKEEEEEEIIEEEENNIFNNKEFEEEEEEEKKNLNNIYNNNNEIEKENKFIKDLNNSKKIIKIIFDPAYIISKYFIKKGEKTIFNMTGKKNYIILGFHNNYKRPLVKKLLKI